MAITTQQLGAFLGEAREGDGQLARYRRLGAAPEILRLIELGGGPAMGIRCERLLRHVWPCLQKRARGANTGYDHRSQCFMTDEWKLLEQKTSGLWSEDPQSFRWQHVEPEHPWNGLLLVGLALDCVKVWGMTRAGFQACVEAGLATRQGNGAGQGYWMQCAAVQAHLIPIVGESSLQGFISTL